MLQLPSVSQTCQHDLVTTAATLNETSEPTAGGTRNHHWYENREIPGDRNQLGVFGQVPMANSIPEFIQIAQVIAKNADRNGICGWRGQAFAGWHVQSGAARRVQKPWLEHFGRDPESMKEMFHDFGIKDARDAVATRQGSSQHEQRVRLYERLLLNDARVNGFDYQDGRRLSELELLASLQHHGAATSLLDITKNVLVALWMAASDEEQEDENGVVIAFGQATLSTVSAEFARKPYRVVMQSMEDERRRAGYWIPSKLNLRIVAQSGFFLLSPIADQPWGTVNLRGTHLWADAPDEDPECYFIGVTPGLKSQMRDAQKYGLLPYAENTIYPDLAGFAAYHGANRPIPFRR